MENKKNERGIEPRYNVSVGMFTHETDAVNRAQLCTRQGIRAEIIDTADNTQANTIAALLLIAEQVKALSDKMDSITQAVKDVAKAEPKPEPKAEKKPEPPKPKTVGDLITAKRREKGMSIRDLAEASGIPRGTLSNYCSGQTLKIPVKSLLVLKDVLNIPNDDIIKFF